MPSRSKSVARFARPALVALLLAACVWALIASWDDVTDALPRVGAVRFVLSTLAAIGAGIALAIGWRILLVDIAGDDLEVARGRLGYTEATAVFSASQLGKYIPGSVWPVVAQMSLARRHGISRITIVAAFVTQMLLLVVTAVVTAALTLPWVDAEELRTRWWLLVIAPAVCLVLVPSVQRRLLALASRALKRPLAVAFPGPRAMAGAVLASVLTYVLFGVHLAVLASPMSPDGDVRVLVQSIGAFALAWAAGFVVIFAPAGLGVREVVLKLTMGSVLVSADATAVAVLSRTSLVIADLALGVFGIAVVALGRRRGDGAGAELAATEHHEHVGRGLAVGRLDVGDEPEGEDLARHQ
nr:lysylphosphatidylglycerol synthase domain-containing protein [Desertimonas flava]